MSSNFTGPLKNKVRTEGPRKWQSGLPIGSETGSYIHEKWDFVKPSDLDTTNDWTVVKDSSAAVAVATDADGGAITLTSEATTDDDGASIQSVQNCFSLSSGKQLWFDCRVKVSDADDMDMFIGLSDTFATNPEAVLADDDKLGFQIDDGDESILCKSEKNGTETSTDSGEDAADDTYVRLSMHYDGAGQVKYYINEGLKATHTTNLPDDLQLCISAMELSGSDSGTKSMTVDYIEIWQER